MTKEAFISILSAKLGVQYTDEQEAFIKDFDKPMISFSLPGTGKTATAVAALLAAEFYDKVPGENIYALSFTVNATAEIKIRHEKALQKAGYSRKQKVVFRTLSAICKDILTENFFRLDMPSFRIVPTPDMNTSIDIITSICEDQGVKLKPYQGRNILDALNYSNSSFIFDRSNLSERYRFIKADIDYDLFMRNRSQIYESGRSIGYIPIGDIILYTLELLMSHPEISAKYKQRCKIMLIDEFQDMSLLQLKVASYLCETLIVIGDINQQIYVFNGACQEIVQEYYTLYPEAVTRNLTQSFRCAPEIAEFSKKIIAPNKTDGENILGFNKYTGTVTVDNNVPLSKIVEEIETSYSKLNYFEKSIFFLARNNYSLLPLSNELFDRKVPFQLSKYKQLYKWPIVKDLVAMLDLLRRPESHDGIWILSRFIPEFRRYKLSHQNPLYKIMETKGFSFLSINFDYEQYDVVHDTMQVFMEVKEQLSQGVSCFPLFMQLYDIYYESYLKFVEDKMEIPSDVVMSALESCCANRPFQQFIANENEKLEVIEENLRRRNGIILTTFHGAKGMEADVVHIFSADKGIIPSKKNLTQMSHAGCDFDVAREIRNERSLIYVACTRAKTELHIHYDSELSPIFTGSTCYARWDKLYEQNSPHYEDLEAFSKFTGGAWCD